jgi:xanthine dehydrogenase YagT iron-sulfur-binding subunit
MSKLSRRTFFGTTTAGVAAVTAIPLGAQQSSETAAAAPPAIEIEPGVPHTSIQFTINGVQRRVEVEDRWTLLELLRDHLGLTGTKLGCDRGECGACTVHMDGKTVYACSQLAAWADGCSIETVESLSPQGQLDPLQVAFIEHDAPQCGFCTSGQLMSAKALLAHNPHPTRDEVKAAMTGNICRCSNYNRYVEAVLAASSAGGSKA